MVRAPGVLRFCVAGGALALSLVCSPGEAHEQRYNVVYAFKGASKGVAPYSGVIVDKSGNLYGTTEEGGDLQACGGGGCGTVFKVSPDGTETTLYKFHGGNDGRGPNAVIRDENGNLYGTTRYGGGSGCKYGCGTVFEITPDGNESVLYAFTGGSDGAEPVAGLLRDKSGNLYGTTEGGGSGIEPVGTVFRVTADGSETVLHSFCSRYDCKDGAGPEAPLIADQAGNLYGTTSGGGTGSSGTVFRLHMRGTKATHSVLYSFCADDPYPDCSDGQLPMAGLAMDKAGNLFGTTQSGGASPEYAWGVVFKLAPDGAETVLHSFNPGAPGGDGGMTTAGVILDRAGDIFGTAPSVGGKCGQRLMLSVVFRLSPSGAETLYCARPEQSSGVIEHNGILYGSGVTEGTGNNGVVYSLKP